MKVASAVSAAYFLMITTPGSSTRETSRLLTKKKGKKTKQPTSVPSAIPSFFPSSEPSAYPSMDPTASFEAGSNFCTVMTFPDTVKGWDNSCTNINENQVLTNGLCPFLEALEPGLMDYMCSNAQTVCTTPRDSYLDTADKWWNAVYGNECRRLFPNEGFPTAELLYGSACLQGCRRILQNCCCGNRLRCSLNAPPTGCPAVGGR